MNIEDLTPTEAIKKLNKRLEHVEDYLVKLKEWLEKYGKD